MPKRKPPGAAANDPAKRQLASLIAQAMDSRHLCQFSAAIRMGIDQPKVSHILHQQLAGYSVQRLITLLLSLGCDVDIAVRLAPGTRRRGALRVTSTLSS